ncbi:MAG TPA: hypothetical protein VMY76_07935 [Gemmatimonadales bacterium]|nr:hypothetical protein [Gemmatimonadales bacterium]
MPGPVAGQVTLSWLPSSNSLQFRVYRGTAPGVTPGTGALIGPVVSGHVESGLAPNTYYYIVTQISEGQESAPSEETRVVTDDAIGLSLVRPVPGGPGGDALAVELVITSDFEIASAVASVADRQAPLVGSASGWRATVDLRELPHGPQRLRLVVTDVQGHHVEAEIPFRYDTPPVLTVQAPLNFDVARPDLHVTASCTDDDATGCAGISIDAVDATGRQVAQLFSTDASSLDVDVPLTGPRSGLIRITAFDRGGQADSVFREILEEPVAAAVQPILHVPGKILDVSADFVLFVDSTAEGSALVRRARTDGTNVTIAEVPRFGPAFLGPSGVVLYVERTDVYPFARLSEWRNGVTTNLGGVFEVRVAGQFAIWEVGDLGNVFVSPLMRRDLGSGSTMLIADDAGNTQQSVAADGDVAYWTNTFGVWWYQDGTGAEQISPPDGVNTYPVTDGEQVIYRRAPQLGDAGPWEIIRQDGAGATVLAAGIPAEPIPGADYAVNGGWAAFRRAGSGGQLQIWTRSPAGEERQVTTFGTSSELRGIGPAGEVLFASAAAASELQLSRPPYDAPSVPVGGAGEFHFLDGELVKTVGTTLFSITP